MFAQNLSILALLAVCGWSIYVRRDTWRCGLRRVLTLSVVFTVTGILLTAPFLTPYESPLLAQLTGIQHFDDFLGHLCFLSGVCAVNYALLYRLVPDSCARHLMLKRVEGPAAISAALMLAMITLSRHLRNVPGPRYADFFNVPCGPYLGIYWTVYASIMVYLLGYMTRLLWVLRRDPRSRLTADLYIVSSTSGMAAATVMYVNVWLHFMDGWVWLLITAPPGAGAVAAALSWRRQRAYSRDDVSTPPTGSRRMAS